MCLWRWACVSASHSGQFLAIQDLALRLAWWLALSSEQHGVVPPALMKTGANQRHQGPRFDSIPPGAVPSRECPANEDGEYSSPRGRRGSGSGYDPRSYAGRTCSPASQCRWRVYALSRGCGRTSRAHCERLRRGYTCAGDSSSGVLPAAHGVYRGRRRPGSNERRGLRSSALRCSGCPTHDPHTLHQQKRGSARRLIPFVHILVQKNLRKPCLPASALRRRCLTLAGIVLPHAAHEAEGEQQEHQGER